MLAADYFVLKRRAYRVAEFYKRGGAYWFTGGVNMRALLVWARGIAAYHVANPSTLGAIVPGAGRRSCHRRWACRGSVPGFAVAFLLTLAIGRRKNGST